MKPVSRSAARQKPTRAIALLWVSALVCAVSLIGWLLGMPGLSTLHHTQSAMVPTTAISIGLLSLALLLVARDQALSWRKDAIIAAPLIALGVSLLSQWSRYGDPLGFQIAGTYRMSSATFICICYVVSALMLRRAFGPRANWFARIIISAGLVTSIYASVTPLLDETAFQNLPLFDGMSLMTAIALTAICLSLLDLLCREGSPAVGQSAVPRDGNIGILLSVPILISPVTVSYALYSVRDIGLMHDDKSVVMIGILLALTLFLGATALINASRD